MPTADEVIVEFEARVAGYEADLKRSAATFERVTNAQQTQIKRLERQIAASSGQIGNTLRGLAGSFAAYLSGRELIRLADSFTRLQNNLRVTGLEGERLKATQDRLFASAQKYGVEVEGLSGLYSSVSQATKRFGASQEEVFTITDSVSAALKITGQSSQEAAGSLLQLGQVFRGTKVQAEEFNSIVDGLYPLLEAAAAGSDRWGGSVDKLIKDVKASEVASRDFFNAIVAGSDVLEKKAANATLTLSSGFTTLRNALVVYFGEADKSNGVSLALGEALNKVAENLDTLIPALATVIALVGVRYVAAAGAATVSTIALGAAATGTAAQMGVMGAATFALQARLAGAATSAEALSFAMGGIGKGGIVTAIILALGAAVLYTKGQIEDARDATGRYADVQKQSEDATKRAADASEKLATAHGKAKEAALAEARAEAEAIKQKKASAQWSLILAKAELGRAIARRNSIESSPFFGFGAPGNAIVAEGGVRQAEANEKAAQKAVDSYEEALKNIEAAISGGSTPGVGAGDGAAGKKAKKSGGSSGPSASDTEQRFNEEMARLRQEEIQAQLALTQDADERAGYSYELLKEEYAQRIAQITNDKNYTKAQREAQIDALRQLYGASPDGDIVVDAKAGLFGQAIERDKRLQLEQEAADLAEVRYRAEEEQLRLQYDLAETSSERRAIALKLLDAEDRHLRSVQQTIIDSETAGKAEKDRAKLIRDSIDATTGGRRELALRANEGPLGRYLRDTGPGKINERIEGYVVDELEAVQDSIAAGVNKALGIKNPLLASLVELFIEQVLIRPIAQALANAGGGGGGIFGAIGSAIGSVFGGGRATGGPVNAGTPYMVGERGQELFVPRQAGFIVPNHALKSGQTTVISAPRFDLRGAVVTAELYADMERISQANAAKAGQAAYVSAVRDTPALMAKRNRFG